MRAGAIVAGSVAALLLGISAAHAAGPDQTELNRVWN
jgi:hypothetical protein